MKITPKANSSADAQVVGTPLANAEDPHIFVIVVALAPSL